MAPRADPARPRYRLDDPRVYDWSGEGKPVAVVDGVEHPVAGLDRPLRGEVAYVVGVNERTFETLREHLHVQALYLYELRVADLTPLGRMDQLVELGIEWNTKATDLSPLRALRELRLLRLVDLPKVRDIGPLSALVRLRVLDFSGGIWNKNRAHSLAPIASLPELEVLTLTNLRVDEDGLRPLAACRSLRELRLSNQFETADYAYLAAHLPDVECDMLAPFVRLGQSIGDSDVMVVGRRKPFLNERTDADRLARYVADFERLVRGFATAEGPG